MRKLIVVALLVACTLLSACASDAPGKTQQKIDVANLPKCFNALESLNIQAYRNQDWCKNIWYERGMFSDYTGEATTCNLFLGLPRPFDVQTQTDFMTVAEAIGTTEVRLHYISNTAYDSDRKLTHAEFHLAACPCVYVYSPSYKDLPEDMPREVYSRINEDWYYIWMSY